MARRSKKKRKAGSAPPNKTYAGSPHELLERLLAEGEWPGNGRGAGQQAGEPKSASGARAATAHDVIQALLPYLSPSEPLELFLDETRSEPRPIDREGQTKAIVRRSGRTRIRLTGGLGEGSLFTLAVSLQHKARQGAGHYAPADPEAGLAERWVPGKASESWKTRVDLTVGLPAEEAQALDREELAWLMNLPSEIKTSTLELGTEALAYSGTRGGVPTPGEFAAWVVAPIAALKTGRRVVRTDLKSVHPEARGLFQNLVLALWVDDSLDPAEAEFLSARADWLGLSAEVAEQLVAEVTSGEVAEFYRAEHPIACRVTFRQTVKALHAAGELGERERKVICFLAGGLDVDQADLAQALGDVAPGPDWAFLAP